MNFSTVFFIQLIVTLLFTITAAILDVKQKNIPDCLNYTLIIFGFLSNMILSLISHNLKYIFASCISMAITFAITYLFWELKMWGGGDVKLFTGIASVIPTGVHIDFLNIFPRLSIYPFSFSVVINSILISFPFLAVFVVYFIVKNNVFKKHSDILVNMMNVNALKDIIELALNRQVKIKNLCEGNIINDYYFDDEKIKELIEDVDGNLKVYKNKSKGCKYYFKSLSGGGITEKDMYLLKIMDEQEMLKNDASVKVSYPFTPAILAGLFVAVFYGDIMMLFTKNLVLVI